LSKPRLGPGHIRSSSVPTAGKDVLARFGFHAVKPAAVALHGTMDVLHDAPITIVLSPDTDSEQVYLPAPESLKGSLFLADRGYLNLTYLSDVAHQGGFFVVRAKEAFG